MQGVSRQKYSNFLCPAEALQTVQNGDIGKLSADKVVPALTFLDMKLLEKVKFILLLEGFVSLQFRNNCTKHHSFCAPGAVNEISNADNSSPVCIAFSERIFSRLSWLEGRRTIRLLKILQKQRRIVVSVTRCASNDSFIYTADLKVHVPSSFCLSGQDVSEHNR